MRPELTLVPAPAAEPSRIDRIRALQAEAGSLALDHVASMTAAMRVAQSIGAEIAAGGEIFAPGVRDLCRRFVEDAEARAATIEALISR